jgi:uncharacterized protein (DUF305 family)
MKSDHAHHNPYLRLIGMVVLSFIAMYVLMYAMVDEFGHVYNNVNQVYMAGLMAAAMVPIELALMRSMYPDRRLNVIGLLVAVVALAACWMLIREQVAVTDRQFLRSMIPHHGGAVLMCEQITPQDDRIRALCRAIIKSQREEIAQMQSLLAEQSQ